MAFYLAVIAGILFFRFRGGHGLLPEAWTGTAADSTLSIAGSSLAPELLVAWTAAWVRDYPTRVLTMPGGTNHALEALLEGRADVALLTRPPTEAEQALFPGAHDEAPPCFPVAFAALRVLRGTASARREVSCAELRALLAGEAGSERRLYVPDPNFGWWDALRAALGEASAGEAGSHVSFLADADSVAVAVARDPAALGIVSALAPPSPRPDVDIVPVQGDSAAAAVFPDDASVADGSYPLTHHLWVVCRPRARGAASMFVTYLTSARGQRLVEREGFLPARRVAREVYLTTPSSPALP